MKTLGDRLAHAMRLRGIGTNQVDIAIGKRGTGYTSRLSKRKRPDAQAVHQIADVLKVRYRWLHFGEGPMEGEQDESELAAQLRMALERPSRTNLDIAAEFYRGSVSVEAVERVRAKSPSLELSPEEVGDMLLEEQRRLIAQAMAKRSKRRAVAEAKPEASSPAPTKRKAG